MFFGLQDILKSVLFNFFHWMISETWRLLPFGGIRWHVTFSQQRNVMWSKIMPWLVWSTYKYFIEYLTAAKTFSIFCVSSGYRPFSTSKTYLCLCAGVGQKFEIIPDTFLFLVLTHPWHSKYLFNMVIPHARLVDDEFRINCFHLFFFNINLIFLMVYYINPLNHPYSGDLVRWIYMVRSWIHDSWNNINLNVYFHTYNSFHAYKIFAHGVSSSL